MDTLDVTRQLTVAERNALEREAELVKLYEMRTSLEPRYTLADQAEALGVSVATVKRWAASEEFVAVAAKLAPPTVSPMVGVARDFLMNELLPLDMTTARAILSDGEAKASTKAAIIKDVMHQALGGAVQDTSGEDRRDAMGFLRERGVQVNGNINVVINNLNGAPAEYRAALLDTVVDADAVEVGQVTDQV
jgi:hypothetical protein